jgi:hypothetical protein
MGYTVTGVKLTTSTPTDPDLCRISGYLKDLHGNALVGQEITIRNIAIPAAVGADTLVLNELHQVRSSSTGYVEFDLFQGATVRVELPGRAQDLVRTLVVPEEDSIDLVAFIFPYLVSVEFDDGATYSADVDEVFTLDITGTMTSGEEAVEGLASALDIDIDDETVLQQVTGTSFRALKAGTAVITITDVDTDDVKEYQEADGGVIERLQHPAITLDAITVTVT